MTESRANIAELTVSELSASLKRTVEDAYGYVRVRGEISGYRGPHSSGHCYLALKDQSAKIDGVIWKGVFARMRIKPEEGMEVVVTGKLTTYPSRSNYQLVIDTLEPAGLGALMALLEERKRKLAAEGLFDDARKQLLPFLPETIGVITSPTGAVIRDILHRLADRFPRHVLVWPVKVQGDGSAEQIAAAIDGFNALPENGPIRRPDLIIVARGGGSLEDLWSFNEEIVVRAAAGSMIPLISAVGHETDTTLIDYAADKRAPTPTAAAEMAVPVRTDLIGELLSKARRALSCWQRAQDHRRTELRAASRALPDSEELLAIPRQRLDTVSERLPRALRANAQLHHTQFSRIAARLSPQSILIRTTRCREVSIALAERSARAQRLLIHRRSDRLAVATDRLGTALRAYRDAQFQKIKRQDERLRALSDRSRRALDTLLDNRDARVESAGQLLTAFSYRRVLARGYALVRDAAGQPLRAAAGVTAGQSLDIEFADGRVQATAQGTETRPAERPALPRRRRSLATPIAGQGTLFD